MIFFPRWSRSWDTVRVFFNCEVSFFSFWGLKRNCKCLLRYTNVNVSPAQMFILCCVFAV